MDGVGSNDLDGACNIMMYQQSPLLLVKCLQRSVLRRAPRAKLRLYCWISVALRWSLFEILMNQANLLLLTPTAGQQQPRPAE
eukprot:scaffold2644_cov89-Skeletonema_dohrnii-CCMP3373.AAC.2